MKTVTDTIIFSLSVVTFIIGVHQTMTYGLAASYFIFMVSIGLLFLYRYRKAKHTEKEKKEAKPRSKSKR